MIEEKIIDLCNILGGKPAPEEEAFDDDGIPFVRMKDLGRYHLTTNLVITDSKIDRSFAEKNNLNPAPKGAILLPRSGSVALNHRAILGQDSIIVSHICALVVKDDSKLSNRYLYYWLCEYDMNRIAKKTTGLDAINFSDLGNIVVSYPDLETQNKIVAILDKANTLLDKREKSIAMYDELLRASFLDMFGNPMERPNRWVIDRIGTYLTDITAGTSYGGENKKALESDELGVLKVSAVTKGIFDPLEYKAVKRRLMREEVTTPKRGDLLFSRANTLELVGATCIVDKDYEDLTLPDKLWRVETDEEKLRKVYLHYVLRNKDVRRNFLSIATGSSGSMLNISMDKFKAIEIPVPPIELQMRFEKQYFKYIDIRNKLLKSTDYLETLNKSLSRLAFSGELKLESGIELEVLLERDLLYFKENIKNISANTIRQLLRRLDKSKDNQNKLYEPSAYDKSKDFLFELLNERKVMQIFDADSKEVKLILG
jgi:type I restriction enzyme, S subunit